jgi:ribosomal protein L32
VIKIIKRILVLLLVVVLCMSMLTACGAQECSICSEVKRGETIDMFGEEVHICNDCIKDINSFLKE